jgi:hypothetical protein
MTLAILIAFKGPVCGTLCLHFFSLSSAGIVCYINWGVVAHGICIEGEYLPENDHTRFAVNTVGTTKQLQRSSVEEPSRFVKSHANFRSGLIDNYNFETCAINTTAFADADAVQQIRN